MKQLLILPLLFFVFSLKGQSFKGHWNGTITRDFGSETKTDSIELDMVQTGDQVEGYSTLRVSPGVFIRSKISGTYHRATKTLRLTETSVDYTNMPDRGEELFLDRYLLSYDENEKEILTGKSIAVDKRSVYTRSKMILKKAVAENNISAAGY